MEHIKIKLVTRIPCLIRLVNEARSMLDLEHFDSVKLTGVHDGLLAWNTKLLKLSGDFSDHFTPAERDTEFQGAAEYSEWAIKTLAQMCLKILAVDPYFVNDLQAPVGKVTQFNQANMPTTEGLRLLSFTVGA